MADAKWASYREPPQVTGHEPKDRSTRTRLEKLRKATRGEGGPDSGTSTGVGSSRRGGSSTLHGGDENMDGSSGSRRFDVLNRRGRPGGASTRQAAPENQQHVELIQDFVRRKYNPAAQFLAFDDIFGDQLLRAGGLIKWPGGGSQDKLADALWKAAGELDPPVLTISAAKNNMGRVHIQRIPTYLPKLRNLSLKDNDLANLNDISNFFNRNRAGGLRHLQEIWLIGNPLRDRFERINDMDQYFYNVASAIRTLKVVDGEPVPAITLDAEEHTKLGRGVWPDGQPFPISYPVPMGPSSVDDHLRDMVGGILSQFFAFYDNDRKNLINAYHANATFSVSAMPNTPQRQMVTPYQPERGVPASLNQLRMLQGSADHGASRNMRILVSATAREMSLHAGHRNILEQFENLPPSRHPLQDGSKFVFDATLLPNMGSGDMLEVSVHGEFAEPNMGVSFSFNRSFVFVTAGPESTAATIGMSVLVLSDMLTIRRLSPSSIWTPGPMLSQGDEFERKPWRSLPPGQRAIAPPQAAPAPIPVAAAQPAPNPFGIPASTPFQQQPAAPVPFQQPQPVPQPVQPTPVPQVQPPAAAPAQAGPAEIPPEMESLAPAQKELAVAFSNITGLVLPATLSVLGENAWDGDAAYAKLMEVKGNIPSEWWIGGAPKI